MVLDFEKHIFSIPSDLKQLLLKIEPVLKSALSRDSFQVHKLVLVLANASGDTQDGENIFSIPPSGMTTRSKICFVELLENVFPFVSVNRHASSTILLNCRKALSVFLRNGISTRNEIEGQILLNKLERMIAHLIDKYVLVKDPSTWHLFSILLDPNNDKKEVCPQRWISKSKKLPNIGAPIIQERNSTILMRKTREITFAVIQEVNAFITSKKRRRSITARELRDRKSYQNQISIEKFLAEGFVHPLFHLFLNRFIYAPRKAEKCSHAGLVRTWNGRVVSFVRGTCHHASGSGGSAAEESARDCHHRRDSKEVHSFLPSFGCVIALGI